MRDIIVEVVVSIILPYGEVRFRGVPLAILNALST